MKEVPRALLCLICGRRAKSHGARILPHGGVEERKDGGKSSHGNLYQQSENGA